MTMMRSKGSPELISSFRQNIFFYGNQPCMQIFPILFTKRFTATLSEKVTNTLLEYP